MGSEMCIRDRFEAEHLAGLRDKKRGPKEPPRKVWLPRVVPVYHLQKAHPDAGKFRLWSLLAQPDISVRTVGRIMALNKLVYDDIPHVRKPGPKSPRSPIPTRPSIATSTGLSMVGRWTLPLTASSGGASSSWKAIPAPSLQAQWPQQKRRGRR